uniref:Eukaryotic translation initiation factor 4 gamma 1 n=1 Tax=Hydra vulgaris TaxID=6087 RepID=T2MEM1_HYDVU
MMKEASQTYPPQIYGYQQVINQNNIQGTVQHMYNQNSQPQQIHSFSVPSTHMTQYATAQPFTPGQMYIQNTDPSQVYTNYNRQYNINATPFSYSSYTPVYQSHSYPHQTQSPQYLVQGYQNGVILQPQQHPSQNQRVYTQPTPSQQIQQHIVPIQQAQLQLQPEYQPKKTVIKLTDPITGDPINYPKKEQEKVHNHMGNPYNQNIALPLPDKIDDKRAQVNANFAAQIAARAEKSLNEEPKESVPLTISDKNEIVETVTLEENNDEPSIDFVEPENEADTERLSDINITEPGTTSLLVTDDSLQVDASNTSDVAVHEEVIENIDEIQAEASPEVLDSNPQMEDVKPSITLKTAQHKKKKKSYRSYDTKEVGDDILSAFVDKPKVEEVPETIKEVKLDNETQPEEVTWENKIIENDLINKKDDEEQDVRPRQVEIKVLKTEDTQEIDNDNEKRQYNRDFLLQFQFAPICTFKPQGLPDIDIVLNEAHAPTKALVPGQRLASNDFIPNYMKQAGGGRSSGGRSSKEKERRGGSGGGSSGASSSGQQKKIVVVPQFEKIELHKSENAWVRPGELMKDLPEEQRERDELARSIRGILNKLTPQKFISLLDKMKELKIDTKEKLEIAIDLIFEKAVSEPVFSVAYANLCHRLIDCFKQPMTDSSTPNGTITFRRILLNKCQKEFDKDSSDEKLLEEDKGRTFDTEAESKLWKADLDQREILNRRRMLGNIRFIGELFKLKMISENIMHDCVIKLLKCEKVESAEDQLECLCKLLATIGKDLDHPKAKFRVDQYFAQMSKIIDRKKISTRIKFAIKDIIDLRSCNWVPRRDDSNPKTIDQIHKEAKDEEKEMEKMRQQDKMRPKERGSQRSIGRDSPAMRGGVSGPPSSADGWTNIPSKSKNFPATPVDASKFKIAKKDDSENISLGPGGFRSSWSRGASGGSSRSSSGAPASVESVQNRQANRYDVLSEQNPPSGVDSKRGSRGSNTSRSSGGKSSREDRSAAIRAVQDITTMKNQFSKHSQSGRDSPRSGAQTPVETMDAAADVDSTVIEISEEDMRKKTKSTINEYLSIRDTNEAITCLKEVNCSYLHYMFVEEAITIVIEMKSEDRKSIGALLHDMVIKNVITVDQLCTGLASIVQNTSEYTIDAPQFYKYLGEVIGPIIYDGALPLNRIKDTLEPLVKLNKAGNVMAEALSVVVQIAGKEELVSELWSKSNIKWEMLLNNDENVDKFIKDKKMEFLMNSTSSNKSHSNNVLKGLLRILQEKGDNNKITSYIDSECSNCKSDPYFIKDLTSMICNSTLKVEDTANTCSCNKDELEKRKNILLKYIDGNKNLELFALYGIQQLVTTLHHPIGLAIAFFQDFYNHDIISEETFFTWKSSKELPDGKGKIISSVKDFLSWLRKAEEESNEEDSTQVFN